MKLAVTGSMIIICTILMLVFGKVLLTQEKAYFEYENQVHKDFCEIAESREASMEYLISNNCK